MKHFEYGKVSHKKPFAFEGFSHTSNFHLSHNNNVSRTYSTHVNPESFYWVMQPVQTHIKCHRTSYPIRILHAYIIVFC